MKERAQLRGFDLCLEMLNSVEVMTVLTISADINTSLKTFGKALLKEINTALVCKVEGEESGGTRDSSLATLSAEEKDDEERKRDKADKASQWNGFLQTLRRLTKAWQSGLAGEEGNKVD